MSSVTPFLKLTSVQLRVKAFNVRSIDLNDYLIDLRGISFISHGKGGAEFYYATRKIENKRARRPLLILCIYILFVFSDLSTSFTMLYNNTKLREKKKERGTQWQRQ